MARYKTISRSQAKDLAQLVPLPSKEDWVCWPSEQPLNHLLSSLPQGMRWVSEEGSAKKKTDYTAELIEKLLQSFELPEIDPFFDSIPLSENPIADWREAHFDELNKYRGKFVAIHPSKGIVASGAVFSDVYKKVDELGLSNEIVLDAIPKTGYR